MTRTTRSHITAALCLSLLPAVGAEARVPERRAPQTATGELPLAERIRDHVEVLAHDELGGRGTGEPGIDLAAGYIAGQLAAIGAQPGGPGGTYFQSFEVAGTGEIGSETALEVTGVELSDEIGEDFVPFGFSARGAFEGEVVFAGYGIDNADKNHDDYAGVDVEGKVVLMLRREPSSHAENDRPSRHARFDHKVELAAGLGAAAVLIVNQNPGDEGIDGLMRFSASSPMEIPALHFRRTAAQRILSASGAGDLTELQRKLDAGEGSVSIALSGVRARGKVVIEETSMTARNVIATLPGSGPDADEYVVIGGHYDHLGTRGGRIYNGADDNASGTAGIIEIARWFAQEPKRNRSLVFIAFSAEERGLLGSRHYVEHPTVPLDRVAAMINMDMIGRVTHDDEMNQLAVHGLGTGDFFEKLVSEKAGAAKIPFLPDPSSRGPSDHAPFNEKGVPSLFFFTGVHSDYHQPGDDIEKVNYEGAAEIVGLITAVANELVMRDDAPKFAEVTSRARIFRGANPGASRVVIGIVPEREGSSEPGWGVAQVVDGGPAAMAGLKSGDRILAIDGAKTRGMSDYLEIVKDKSPGDVVVLEVKRGHETLQLSVALGSR